MYKQVSLPDRIENVNDLFEVANVINDSDFRTGLNVQYRPIGLTAAHGELCWNSFVPDEEEEGDTEEPKVLENCEGFQTFPSVTIQGGFVSNPLLRNEQSEDLKKAFEAALSTAVSRVLINGTADYNNPLSVAGVFDDTQLLTYPGYGVPATADDPLSLDATAYALPTTPDAADAVALIEQYFLQGVKSAPGAGTIYIPAHLVSQAKDALRVEKDGRLYTNATGSQVVVTGVVADTIYGHIGEIDIYLSEVATYDAFDREINTNTVVVEQQAVAVFDSSLVLSVVVGED